MPKLSSKGISTPFAVVILVGLTTIICIGLYWLYLESADEADALSANQITISRSTTNTNTTIDANSQLNYIDTDAHFGINIPDDWTVKENYYYETAGGEKATVPTVILSQRDAENTDLNLININLRQSFCMASDTSTEETETFGDVTVKTINYSDSQWCSQAEVKGVDINQNHTLYNFVSNYNQIEVQEVFKEMVQSFNIVL